jgi:hypothetical protein
MPTYDEALAANPSGFVDYAAEMTSAGTDLTEHRTEYGELVSQINDDWQDQANRAFNDDVGVVGDHVDDVVSQVGEAAGLLDAGGVAMVSQVEQLKATDAAYRGAGFTVQSEPRVELGAVHWAAIAAAGPFGPMLQALFQARADEGTTRLRLGLAMLTATDVVTGAGLTAAAQRLRPMEDKGGRDHTICPTVVGDDDGGTGQDDSDRKGRSDTGRDTGDDRDDGKGRDEKKSEKDEEGKDEEGKDEKEQDDPVGPEPQEERPQAQQPDTGLPEDAVPGMEQPDPVGPDAPDFTGPDPASPELPEFDGGWDPAELGDAELPSGGLAGGGGGIGGGGLSGGGLGPPDLPSGGSGGQSGGGFTAPVGSGAPAAATGAGARPGMGGLMGAPGARGAAVPDDEVERESLLTEDPEEDVWGIGTAENNPYVDYQDERPDPLEPAPAPADAVPPFVLPGFDLPSDRP